MIFGSIALCLFAPSRGWHFLAGLDHVWCNPSLRWEPHQAGSRAVDWLVLPLVFLNLVLTSFLAAHIAECWASGFFWVWKERG